ncbi:TetR/AcrR family transcriptional regulator [Aestuariivirga litoralis]|uniref:TetR/AcrR family transcriptional regulator n=1 Tax=Aestuariivirga litoralis TaxID=2650924 RepID=A0A2W2AKQ2_9HYPH|nr:TetR family transcriptional regulator [Aestuariivirga litoralis]PZF75931.1 TetR/AcrR family transcriptional regulator [Aestuariivirga litoralis]
MRVSREEAQASRKRIIQEAARLMRERGIAATSVADVMTAAGMTTGGFYKHFKSKDDLTAAALAAAFDGVLAPLQLNAEKSGLAPARAAYLRQYLSQGHVANPGKGCPVAAMGADCGRESSLLGPEFTRGVEATLAFLGADECTKPDRAALIRQMATLVGSVVLARAVGEGPMREEILSAAASAAKPLPRT